MKKIISLLLVLTMVAVLFVGCGASDDAAPAEDTSADSKVQLQILETAYVEEDYAIAFAKDNEELLAKVDGALQELIEDGTAGQIIDKYISGVENDLVFQQDVAEDAEELIMATNAAFPPYEFYENEKIVGIDAEIAAAIADKLGMKLTISDMSFDSILAAVTSGKADMGMAGMTVTEERLQNVNFSTSYATGIQAVIVPEGSPITSVDDLYDSEYNIGVQIATTGDIYATDDFGDDHVQRYNIGADAVQALVSGKIDCVIIDIEPAKAFVAANNG